MSTDINVFCTVLRNGCHEFHIYCIYALKHQDRIMFINDCEEASWIENTSLQQGYLHLKLHSSDQNKKVLLVHDQQDFNLLLNKGAIENSI